MKPVVLLLLLLSLVVFCPAQNQIQLYVQQIAANKVYIEYLQKGCQIAKNGLNTIGNIQDGHFNLDKDFFSQLENINPKVRHYAKVAAIIALNVQIIKRYKKALVEAQTSDSFNSGDLDYLTRVFNVLFDNCETLNDELTVLLTASKWKMSDEERIKRIDSIHSKMRDNYSFVNYFSDELQIMAVQKKKDRNDVMVLNDLYSR